MLAKEGMTVKDVEIVEMAPPDMPAALYARAVDAYATASRSARSRRKRAMRGPSA
jgi:NitT/TauT family transport system substrate-binding protein